MSGYGVRNRMKKTDGRKRTEGLRILGVTGGIGCGKSEVCGVLKNRYGAFVITADEIGHTLMKKGGGCYDDLTALLGGRFLDQDGEFDRKKLGDFVFSDPDLLTRMNKVIHPAVHENVLRLLDTARTAHKKLAVIEAALLLEAGYQQICEEVWYIHAEKNVRMKRLKEGRGISENRMKTVMANQLSEEEFRAFCDYTIDNSMTPDITAMQIEERLRVLEMIR